jgi:cobalt ECF transporter T component CbiQ
VNPTVQSSNRSSFVERTLTAINESLEHSLFADTIARQDGLLQSLDARLKLVSLLLLLISVGASHNLTVIASLYLVALILAVRSHIPLRFFTLRIWTAVLLFTGLVTLPGIFITPGPVLLTIIPGVSITRTGSLSAVFLILRAVTSVSLTTLLVLSTRWNTVLKALGVLHIPDVVVLILGMTYRYIHLLLHAANDMFLSRKSRILRKLSPPEERILVSAMSGALLSKSLQVSSDVYLAMQSRGFRYYPKTMESFQFFPKDILAGIIVLILCTAALWLGR